MLRVGDPVRVSGLPMAKPQGVSMTSINTATTEADNSCQHRQFPHMALVHHLKGDGLSASLEGPGALDSAAVISEGSVVNDHVPCETDNGGLLANSTGAIQVCC